MSISRHELISSVAVNYDSYSPSQEVLDKIGQLDLTMVTAPTGMGKDTLITATQLPRVLAETIRPPRSNNGVMEQDGVDYEFRGNDLDGVLSDFQNGNYVQIGMGPSKMSFYATRAANYPASGPALIDVMTNQVEGMRQLPFRSAEAVQITAPSYDTWISRLLGRGTVTEEDWYARRAEAKTSISDALQDEKYLFILNDDKKIAAAALHRYATARDFDVSKSKKARNAAYRILIELNGE